MTPSDLDEMIEEIDIDGSGTVDWEGKINTLLHSYTDIPLFNTLIVSEFKAMMIG